MMTREVEIEHTGPWPRNYQELEGSLISFGLTMPGVWGCALQSHERMHTVQIHAS